MRRVIIERPGSWDQLKIKEFPDPEPKENEVLIEVHAFGINFADCLVRMGLYKSAKEFIGWPITPGFEVSGVITKLGAKTSKFSLHQRVIALTLFNGYATHLAIPEDQVFPLPDGFTFEEGAGCPTVFLTAYFALFELARPRRGETLLIHSAAGGVGSALLQLGKLAGCRTLAVVGAPHKVSYVNQLGADRAVDKSVEDLWKEAKNFSPKGYDIILDANGAETLREDYKHLKKGGKLVVYGFHSMFSKGLGKPNWFKLLWNYIRTPKFNPLTLTSDNISILAFNLSFLFDKKEVLTEDLALLLKWFQEKKLVPPKIKTYALHDIKKAHQDLESGNTIGKLVVKIK